MAEFLCRLGTPSGEVITKIVEASNQAEAKNRLEGEGFRVFTVSTSEGGLGAVLTGGTSGSKNKVKSSDFLLFNQQLSALLRAGIPVLQAIGLLKERSGSAALRTVLADVEEKIRTGVPLSDAFESQRTFPRIYTASLHAGERSGSLDEVLARYVHYLKRSVGISRKLRSVLAYPAFLLLAATLMVGFLVLYIVPRMSNLFEGLNTASGLPTVTLIVLTISTAVAGNIWWILPLLIILIVSLFLWLRTNSGKLMLHKILLRSPLGGELIKQMTAAQLSRSLSTLISGGLTVPDSWDISSQAITNLELRRRSQSVLPMIREGRSFTEALETANWMPALGLDMIGIGENSGSLKEMLDEVAEFYDAESEVRLEQLTTLLEPIILVFMAAVVVIILLAIYLPIIQAISSGPFGGR
ncbi:MAG: type II secretion system F family protein [Pyrinomonadaceae bacterium]|nr:type II secretion system F family protein [Pyrinomonadaceae bacterium]